MTHLLTSDTEDLVSMTLSCTKCLSCDWKLWLFMTTLTSIIIVMQGIKEKCDSSQTFYHLVQRGHINPI